MRAQQYDGMSQLADLPYITPAPSAGETLGDQAALRFFRMIAKRISANAASRNK
jgi:hypothetical protein